MKLSGQEDEAFKPGGKPEARIFTGINTTFADGENHTKFDLGRAYLGYNYNFTKKLSGRVVYDVANPSVGKLQFTGMLKFAYFRYQTEKLIITGGMIPLPEYAFGDKVWGYRYVYKTSHDDYGFGTSADLGLSAVYNFTSWLSADVTIMNGEGFKLMESDSTFKAAAAITIMPVKNISMRGYFDNMTKNGINQQTLEIITAYESRAVSLAAAYNFRKNNTLKTGYDYHSFSVNGSVPVSEKIRIFGRFDYLFSEKVGNETDPWNLSKDGQLFLTGIEFVLAPGVYISPNYQGWNPAGAGMPFITRFSLSLDLKI